MAQNSTISLVVKALNPATVIDVGKWTVQIFYQKETVLDKLIAQGSAASVPITNTTAAKTYWDRQFKAQTEVIVGQRGVLTFILKESTGVKTIDFPAGVITVPENTQPLCIVTTNIYS